MQYTDLIKAFFTLKMLYSSQYPHVISFTPKRKVWPSLCNKCQNTSCADLLHRASPKSNTVERRDRNFFMLYNKVQVPVHQFSKKSVFLNGIKHQFTCTGQEIGKVGHKIHLYPYVKYDFLNRFSVNSCLLYNLLPRTHIYIYNFMKTYCCY